MRRLALVFAILVAVSASEHIAMSPRASGVINAFAARVMRMPVRFGLVLRGLQRVWRQRWKALPMAGVN
jgi:hypothetical protein